MGNEKIFNMAFSGVHPLLLAKAERKGRSREEVQLAKGKALDKILSK